MKRAWTCRRTFVALVGMAMLFCLGCMGREAVAGPLVTVVMAIAAANATEGALKAKHAARATQENTDATPNT